LAVKQNRTDGNLLAERQCNNDAAWRRFSEFSEATTSTDYNRKDLILFVRMPCSQKSKFVQSKQWEWEGKRQEEIKRNISTASITEVNQLIKLQNNVAATYRRVGSI
jgi:hypothetical protein